MGSPNAATIMDLLSAINESDTFLGKCGGLKRIQIGDFTLLLVQFEEMDLE